VNLKHVRSVPARFANRAPSKDDRFWRIENRAGSDVADLYLFDEVSFYGIDANSFRAELDEVKASKLRLRINSPGGDVFDGIAIANLLRARDPEFEVVVDGLAASIASVIAVAGGKVTMSPNSQMMIHDASGIVMGDAEDMRSMAKVMDKISDNIAGAYATKAGGDPAEWRKRMRAETWFSAAEAVESGLADEAVTPEESVPPDEAIPDASIDAKNIFDFVLNDVPDVSRIFASVFSDAPEISPTVAPVPGASNISAGGVEVDERTVDVVRESDVRSIFDDIFSHAPEPKGNPVATNVPQEPLHPVIDIAGIRNAVREASF
jgi:ATP-dependent Clp endopeptidase proteolytic subunit ClpP